jgi:hypothetical protein
MPRKSSHIRPEQNGQHQTDPVQRGKAALDALRVDVASDIKAYYFAEFEKALYAVMFSDKALTLFQSRAREVSKELVDQFKAKLERHHPRTKAERDVELADRFLADDSYGKLARDFDMTPGAVSKAVQRELKRRAALSV